METYHLNRVVPKLLKFVDLLTNWYVRFNRKRLKGETGPEDCVHALTTLYTGTGLFFHFRFKVEIRGGSLIFLV